MIKVLSEGNSIDKKNAKSSLENSINSNIQNEEKVKIKMYKKEVNEKESEK